MSEIYALVAGTNYSGSWTVYQSLPDAQRFAKLLQTEFAVPEANIATLYSAEYTAANVVKQLELLAKKIDQPHKIGVIYFAGHGTQVVDRNGDESDHFDEALQTNDHRLVIDDQITDLVAKSCADSWIVTIADTCHSPSLDMLDQYRNRKWVSIKAALDSQSALQSGDGSCMSVQLFELLKERNFTVRSLFNSLDAKLRASFVGALQSCKITVSNDQLWEQQFPLEKK